MSPVIVYVAEAGFALPWPVLDCQEMKFEKGLPPALMLESYQETVADVDPRVTE